MKSIATSAFAIIYVAIGFAFFETGCYIYFLSDHMAASEVLSVAAVRIFISSFSHMLFSAIIGYYYGKALFMKYELIDNLEISKTTKCPSLACDAGHCARAPVAAPPARLPLTGAVTGSSDE